MKVARVVGNLVASAHHPAYDGHKIMLVRPEGPKGEPPLPLPARPVEGTSASSSVTADTA